MVCPLVGGILVGGGLLKEIYERYVPCVLACRALIDGVVGVPLLVVKPLEGLGEPSLIDQGLLCLISD